MGQQGVYKAALAVKRCRTRLVSQSRSNDTHFEVDFLVASLIAQREHSIQDLLVCRWTGQDVQEPHHGTTPGMRVRLVAVRPLTLPSTRRLYGAHIGTSDT